MKKQDYVPGAGDIVWLNFTPQAGHEQAGHRPAVVLTRASYNRSSGLLICVPMTSQVKGYPFEVPISSTPSVALADQAKSVDWVARKAKYKGHVDDDELERIQRVVAALIGRP